MKCISRYLQPQLFNVGSEVDDGSCRLATSVTNVHWCVDIGVSTDNRHQTTDNRQPDNDVTIVKTISADIRYT